MKLVLIRPQMTMAENEIRPQSCPPLGLAYLAAYMREAGHDVHVIDAVGEALQTFNQIEGVPHVKLLGLPIPEILRRVPRDAEMIGIACMFSIDWPNAREIMTRIREEFPDAVIVAGGEHIAACTEFIMQDCPALDYAVLGEGEMILAELAETLEKGGDVGEVAGLVHRVDGRTRINPKRNRVKDIDSFPLPAWDLFPLENYLDGREMIGVDLGRSIPMLASRGCPYECTFCSNPKMWGRLWKARDQELIIAEMKLWMERYQVTNFDFYDLTAIVRKDWIVKMTNLILENDLNITWQLPIGTRSEALDAEVLDLLYKSGCRQVTYAPESGSNFILKYIKKKISKTSMLRSIRAAYKAGVKTKANILIGFPDEKLSHVLEDYWFALRMAVAGLNDISFFRFSPYPGSALYDRLLAEGRFELTDDYFHALVENRKSFSNHLPSWSLPVLGNFGMALFYGFSFLIRPRRFVSLVRALWSEQAQTRLDAALIRVKRHRRRFLGLPELSKQQK
jgi:anaerobic magnesium-protoporphyrin IX monomethyl ester cyclase